MNAQILKVTEPVLFFEKHFEKQSRIDGRNFEDFRLLSVNCDYITTSSGSCLVKRGQTVVVAAVKPQIAEVTEKVTLGCAIVNADFPAFAGAEYRGPGPHHRSQAASWELSEAVDRVVDKKQLAAGDGLIWNLFVDAICLNDAGNAQDVLWTAVFAALQHTSLPSVSVSEEGMVQVTELASRKLRLDSLPIRCTFGVYNDIIVADLSDFEEKVVQDSVTIVADNTETTSLIKVSGRASDQAILRASQLAKAQYAAIASTINQ